MPINSYQVNYSDPSSNGGVPTYAPEQQVVVLSLSGTSQAPGSVQLVGRNYPGYAQIFNQNFLTLLTNSAAPTAPTQAQEGQLWYDNSPGANRLNVKAKTGWIPVNGVWELPADSSGNFPTVQDGQAITPKAGDIWVETTSSILYINNGRGSWIQIGPSNTSGSKNGAYPTILVDASGQSHSVIIMYLNDVAIEIIAKEQFQPSPLVLGFNYLNVGVNLNSSIGSVTPTFNGLGTVAASLQQVSSAGLIQTIPGSSFLRNDINQSINGQFTINNDNGLKIGQSTATVIIQKSFYKAIFSNAAYGGQFVFNTFDTNKTPNQILTLDGSTNRIGVNTINPSLELDVTGGAHVSKQLFVSWSTFTDYRVVPKKFIVGGDSYIDGSLQVTSSLAVNTTATFVGTATVGNSILLSTSTTQASIGSQSIPFNTIYGNTISANLFKGSLFAGPAQSLTATTLFSLTGPIQSVSPIGFNGTNNVSMTTTVASSLITGLAPYPSNSTLQGGQQFVPYDVDLIPIYSSGNGAPSRPPGIFNVSKSKFLQNIAPNVCPAGMIAPYAGLTLPIDSATGYNTWAWCDGNAYLINNLQYTALYSAIGTTYGGYTVGSSNYFLVPNLNGSSIISGDGGDGPFSMYTTSTIGAASRSIPSVGIKYIIKL
jgi:hypothetical protein